MYSPQKHRHRQEGFLNEQSNTGSKGASSSSGVREQTRKELCGAKIRGKPVEREAVVQAA
jgi:hypothetical protein